MAVKKVLLVPGVDIPVTAVGSNGSATAEVEIIMTGAVHMVHFKIEAGQNAGIAASLKDDAANAKVIASKSGTGHATRYPRFQADDGAGTVITGVYVPHTVNNRSLTLYITGANPGLVGSIRIEVGRPN